MKVNNRPQRTTLLNYAMERSSCLQQWFSGLSITCDTCVRLFCFCFFKIISISLFFKHRCGQPSSLHGCKAARSKCTQLAAMHSIRFRKSAHTRCRCRRQTTGEGHCCREKLPPNRMYVRKPMCLLARTFNFRKRASHPGLCWRSRNSCPDDGCLSTFGSLAQNHMRRGDVRMTLVIRCLNCRDIHAYKATGRNPVTRHRSKKKLNKKVK